MSRKKKLNLPGARVKHFYALKDEHKYDRNNVKPLYVRVEMSSRLYKKMGHQELVVLFTDMEDYYSASAFFYKEEIYEKFTEYYQEIRKEDMLNELAFLKLSKL